jgi:hypothetical protein
MPDLTPDKLTWVIIFLVPGFVFSRVYALRCPAQKKDWEKAILEFLAYSLFNLIGSFWLVIPILKTKPEEWVGWQISLTGLWVCFVSPTLLAILWSWIRTRSWVHHNLGMDHPLPTGWDYFMDRNRTFWVLFHLKGGKMLGGFFGGESYASAFPQEPDIFVEEVWRVDEEGHFVEMVPGTLGAVVRQSDWERVEFLEVQLGEGANVGVDQKGEGATGAQLVGGIPGDNQSTEDRTPAGRIGNSATEDRTTTKERPTKEVGANHAPGA